MDLAQKKEILFFWELKKNDIVRCVDNCPCYSYSWYALYSKGQFKKYVKIYK